MLPSATVCLFLGLVWAVFSDPFLPPLDYPCHCNGHSGCPEGTCPSGCEHGWSGIRCQLGNLAFNKVTEQSSTYSDYTSSNAVDGRLPTDSSSDKADYKNCSHTGDGFNLTAGNAWWQVDLGSSYAIVNVSITKRASDKRLQNFSIFVGNESSEVRPGPAWTLCAHQSSLQPEIDKTYTCSSPISGQYVMIRLDGPSNNTFNVIILCEVYVFGYVPKPMPRPDEDMLSISSNCGRVTINVTDRINTTNVLTPNRLVFNWTDSTTKSYNSTILHYPREASYVFRYATGFSYRLQVTLAVCANSSNCQDGGSLEYNRTTGSRQATVNVNGTCVTISFNATSSECTVPDMFNVSCSAKGLVPISYGGPATNCSFQRGRTYECKIKVPALDLIESYVLTGIQTSADSYFNSERTSFPCLCRDQELCRQGDGACNSGCKNGSGGPGCQSGKMSHHAYNIRQSSTVSSWNATFGPDRALDDDVATCSKTEPYISNVSWWKIALADDLLYYIDTITITLPEGQLPTVLVTNDTSYDKIEGNSITCQFKAVDINDTIICHVAAPARSVIVRSDNSYQSGLSLCDVVIAGYLHKDCSTPESFGPGCLLRRNNSQACQDSSGTTGVYGECLTEACIDDNLRPPQCWQVMPIIGPAGYRVKRYCDNLFIDINSSLSYTFPDSNYTVQLKLQPRNSNGWIPMITYNYERGRKLGISISQGGSLESFYQITAKYRVCDSARCSNGPPTVMLFENELYGTAPHSLDDDCVNVSLIYRGLPCSVPPGYEAECTDLNQQVISAQAVGGACGFPPGEPFSCVIRSVSSPETYVYIKTKTTSESNWALIGGIAGALLAAILSTIGAIILWKRHRKQPPGKSSNQELPMVSDRFFSASNEETSQVVNDVAPEKIYDNLSGMTLEEFRSYVKRTEYILSKFQELQNDETESCSIGKKTENKPRNRFQNIVPYDANRVILPSSRDNFDGYINASYINGYSEAEQYIAAQGPSEKTVPDFWRMVWQENTSVIIMLTNFFENGKKKCDQYFPYQSSPSCEIDVSVRSSTEYDGYRISELELSQGASSKLVTHCHYVSWPDHSVPDSLAHFAIFRERVRRLESLKKQNAGCAVIHCSAGAGRTGAYIAIDIAMKRFIKESCVDIDSCVLSLRRQRLQMVQTKEQYIFVHNAVLHGMLTERFAISKSGGFSNGQLEPRNCESLPAEEWQVTQSLAAEWDATDYETALKPENVGKNRRKSVLASDKYRRLLNCPDTGNEIYVNAVYCSGWYHKNAFLATQIPLPDTVSDFWKLVYETESSCIVILDDPKQAQTSIPYIPPDVPNSQVLFHPFIIRCHESQQVQKCFTFQNVSLAKEASKEAVHDVTIFKLMSQRWPAKSELPDASHTLVDLANRVRSFRNIHQGKPVIVQCLDGASRCGVFIAVLNCLDRLTEEGDINVVHIVELLRTSQPKFITGKAQYDFIHRIIDDELNERSSNVYANL